MKMGEGAQKTISCTKVWACFLKSISFIIAFLFFSQTNLVFQFKLILDWIILATIYLTFCFLIFCVSWSSSSASTLFIRTSKTFIRLSVFFLRFTSAKYSYYAYYIYAYLYILIIFIIINVLSKKCIMKLMKFINTSFTNLIKLDLARVRKIC